MNGIREMAWFFFYFFWCTLAQKTDDIIIRNVFVMNQPKMEIIFPGSEIFLPGSENFKILGTSYSISSELDLTYIQNQTVERKKLLSQLLSMELGVLWIKVILMMYKNKIMFHK
jgi:hypothetical protein